MNCSVDSVPQCLGAHLSGDERAAREVLSLPMHPLLTEWDQDPVAAAVLTAVG